MLQLHHSSNRWEVYKDAGPLKWDTDLNCWCVFSPKIIADISRRIDFHVVNYPRAAQTIIDRVGMDLSVTRSVFDEIPLANEGETHTTLRRKMAHAIADYEDLAVNSFQLKLEELAQKIFSPNRTFDLVGDLFAPLFDSLVTKLVGTAISREFAPESISQIFDRMLSLNRRRSIEKQLRALVENFENKHNDLHVAPLAAVALMVLGKDALIGSLSCSLHAVLKVNSGIEFCKIEWPHLIPFTGVPYIERIAMDSLTFGTHHIGKGDRVRLYFDACSKLVGSPEEILYFGTGRHTCLGRKMSQRVWKALVDNLHQKKIRARVGKFEFRSNDYVFNYPTCFVGHFYE
jgi:cytochrome P450